LETVDVAAEVPLILQALKPVPELGETGVTTNLDTDAVRGCKRQGEADNDKILERRPSDRGEHN
jgi:hypothetical protein